MSTSDFIQFLKQARTCRSTSQQIVLGNESADLDSVVSSLMMAYFLKVSGPSGAHLPLPVINIPRQELRLRADIPFLLNRLKINETNLTFIDEIDLTEEISHRPISLTLVDHNQLAPHQAHLKKWVTTIIDHHIESEHYDPMVKKMIQRVGSTATLIWSLFLHNHPDSLDRNLARFLLAPILMDTTLLGDPIKTTDPDQQAVNWLSSKAQINIPVFYDLIQAKKRDLGHLTAREVLKKDFKVWRWDVHTGGISSTPEQVEQLLQIKKGLLKAIKKLVEENHFDFYMIMGSGYNPYPGRDLLFWCPNHKLIKRLISHLQKSTIGLKETPFTPIKTGFQAHLYYFQQKNALFSRKMMAAELHSFFSIN